MHDASTIVTMCTICQALKNMIKVVKDHFGSKKTDPVRVIEFTIKDAFDLFVKKIHM